MRKTKQLLCLLLALAMVFVLCGCNEEKVEETMALTIAMSGVPDSLDPAMVDSETEATLVTHIYENLMRPTVEGTVPAMAKSYTVTDNLDGTETYTFTLRDNIKWSDGSAVTARDFVYAWRRLVDPNTASPNATMLNMIKGYEAARQGDVAALEVTAENDTTFTVALSGRCAYFVSSICTAAATMPVKESATAHEGWDITSGRMVTNGAYRVRSMTKESVGLSLRSDYHDAKHINVQDLKFLLGTKTPDAMAAYEAGEVDVVMKSEQVEGAELSYNTDVTVLLVNQTALTLQDEALRCALSDTIDRNALSEMMGKQYVPAEGLVPHGIYASEGTFRELNGPVIDNLPENYETKCEAAMEDIRAAGIAPAYLGYLTVELLYEAPRHTALATALQGMWQEKLGVQVSLRAVGGEDMLTNLQTSNFTIALTTVTTDRNDAIGYLDRFGSSSTINYGLYYSAPFDMLLNVAHRSSDAQARDAYLEDAERLLVEGGYVIPLLNTTHHWLVRSDLVGAFDGGSGAHYFGSVRVRPAQ